MDVSNTIDGSRVIKDALIKDYDGWDEYEGYYTYYECGGCGEYLTDSLAMTFRGEKMPKQCPRCGAHLKAVDEWHV